MTRNIKLEGKHVLLQEVQPMYFEDIIRWRNNPAFNKFLNQPYVLTMELEKKWYEKYLQDPSQGLFVLIDKNNNRPFGTLGWTDYDSRKKECIAGRALVGELSYRGSVNLIEGLLLFHDYLNDVLGIDISYAHVVDDNKKVISFNKKWGYHINTGEVRFPNELLVNGMRQTEYLRTRSEYASSRKKIMRILDLLELDTLEEERK